MLETVITAEMAPECPSCALDFKLPEGTEEGEIIPCPDCGLDLEVISTTGTPKNPEDPNGDGILKKAPEEKEDWGE